MNLEGAAFVLAGCSMALVYILWDIWQTERREWEREARIREALDLANGRPVGPDDDEPFLSSL